MNNDVTILAQSSYELLPADMPAHLVVYPMPSMGRCPCCGKPYQGTGLWPWGYWWNPMNPWQNPPWYSAPVTTTDSTAVK